MLSGLVTLPGGAGRDVAIRPDVLKGIQQASASTGVDFSYLMAQANRESSFNPTAEAKSSSAAGLYQFIEQTWLGVVKQHGAEHGQEDLAAKITRRNDGRFVVPDSAVKQQILDLRRDPAFAAAMAAEHAADNKAKLEDKLGRDATGADLYMAHFLGISGAIKFLRTQADNPERTGASLFPKAAAANPSVFYTPGGRARTVDEIYDRFESRINSDMATYASLETTDLNMADAGAAALSQAAVVPAAVGSLVDLSAARMAQAGPATGAVAAPASPAPASAPEIRGFSQVGGLLSPLMLVTLAAMPVGRDDDKEDRPKSLFGNSNAAESAMTAVGADANPGGSIFSPGLFRNTDDPLRLDLVGSAYAI